MSDNAISKLYNTDDLKTMKWADEARMPGHNRVEEIKNFAKISGIKRIGIANCVAVQKEADLLKNMLSDEFEIYSIDCKCGKIQNSDIIGPDAKGISCNPSGQAEYLALNNTEINISMGLCVGHDMVFGTKSKAPVTTLIVKDRQFKHNPIETFKNS